MTKIKLVFTVFGEEFEPNTITDLIQIEPSTTHLKGELIPNRAKAIQYKETSWEFSTDYQNCIILDELLVPFWKRFETNIMALSEFIQGHRLQSKLYVVAYISENEMPGIYFQREIIKGLFHLNGEIDIDLYSN